MEDFFDRQAGAEKPSPGELLKTNCQKLMLQHADFTGNTGEKGWWQLDVGNFPDSYTTLSMQHIPHSEPVDILDTTKRVSEILGPYEGLKIDDPSEEGDPPFLDRSFHFMISQRRGIHPDLEELPLLKVMLPKDSRVDYVFGMTEFYLDNDNVWKTVQYGTPYESLVEKLTKNDSVDYMEEVPTVISEAENTDANVDLEKLMGEARKASSEELEALNAMLMDSKVLQTNPRHAFSGLVQDESARDARHIVKHNQVMDIETVAPPQVLASNDELCRFLLDNTANAQMLSGQNLATEVDIVGVRANRGVGGLARKMLEDELKQKAEAAKEKYELSGNDAVAFEQLLNGFSQASLDEDRPMGTSQFAVRVIPAETTLWNMHEETRTEYPLADAATEGNEHLSFRTPKTQELAAYDLQLGELDMTSPAPVVTIQASPKLYTAVVGEFSRVAVVDGQNRQLRKSPDRTFKYTVVQAPASLSERQPTEFYVVPIHRVGQLQK